MARLPRYQESGLVAGDIPKLDFANLREESQGMANIGNALDRVSQFAFGEAKKEEDRVNKLTAIQVRTELEAVVQKRFAELSLEVDRGVPVDFNFIQSEIQAMSGYSDALVNLDIDQANGLLSSIRNTGKTLLAKTSDAIVKREQAAASVLFQDLSDTSEIVLANDLYVNPDPNYISARTNELRGKGLALAGRTINPVESMAKFEKSLSAAKSSAIANFIGSSEFATSPTEARAKLAAGDVGKFSGIWNGLSEDEKDDVFARFNKSIARTKSLVDAEYQSAEISAAPIVRELLTTDDAAKKKELIGKLEGLPLPPDKLKAYQGYVDEVGVFASTEDPSLVLNLTRLAESGNLKDSDLIRNRGNLTKETFNSLVRSVANPNSVITSFGKRFDMSVGIQSANLPPNLPTEEGRNAAVSARNRARLELGDFANTPVNGRLPSTAEVTAKAREIESSLSDSMAPVFGSAVQQSLASIEALVPELKGVDLTDDAKVNAAIQTYTARVGASGAGTAASAREEITKYRVYKSKVK